MPHPIMFSRDYADPDFDPDEDEAEVQATSSPLTSRQAAALAEVWRQGYGPGYYLFSPQEVFPGSDEQSKEMIAAIRQLGAETELVWRVPTESAEMYRLTQRGAEALRKWYDFFHFQLPVPQDPPASITFLCIGCGEQPVEQDGDLCLRCARQTEEAWQARNDPPDQTSTPRYAPDHLDHLIDTLERRDLGLADKTRILRTAMDGMEFIYGDIREATPNGQTLAESTQSALTPAPIFPEVLAHLRQAAFDLLTAVSVAPQALAAIASQEVQATLASVSLAGMILMDADRRNNPATDPILCWTVAIDGQPLDPRDENGTPRPLSFEEARTWAGLLGKRFPGSRIVIATTGLAAKAQ